MQRLQRLALSTLALTFSTAALAETIGYYDMDQGQGNTAAQEPAIIDAGHTPLQIVDLSPAELSSIDVLWVLNPDNGGYGAEYLGAVGDIETAVAGGLVLMIHDRYVEDAETILPGGASFDVIRDFTDDAEIEVLDDTTPLTSGPGGTIDDTTLDGGNSSSHGYAVVGSLPAGATFLFSRSNPDEIVDFSYPHVDGAVFYSSIPLDFYLGGGGPFDVIYARNAVAYSVFLANAAGGRRVYIPLPAPTLGDFGLLLMVLMLAGVAVLRLRNE